MGFNQKELRSRIRSVSAMLQLTGAMSLVASARIRRCLEQMEGSRTYREEAKRLLGQLPPEFLPRGRQAEGGRTKVILIAGDRGMAGGFNQRLFRLLGEEPAAEVIPIGARAAERLKDSRYPQAASFSAEDAAGLAERLCREYEDGKLGRLLLLYTRFRNMLTQEPVYETVLPLPQAADGGRLRNLIAEPDVDAVRRTLLPVCVGGIVFAAVKESLAAETAARLAAMDAAGRSAREMLDDLQLKYNRARQNAITQEITEIVSGADS